MRVVLDTNILVSALIAPAGNPAAILKSLGYGVSELEHRDYGQTEFFLTDDDGHSHCFGVPTQR